MKTVLKEQFTQNEQLNIYQLTIMLMESESEFHSKNSVAVCS